MLLIKLGIYLPRVKDENSKLLSIEELLASHKTGSFLLSAANHCIAVDLTRNLIYDPALPYAVDYTRTKNKILTPVNIIRMCLGIKAGPVKADIRLIKQFKKIEN